MSMKRIDALFLSPAPMSITSINHRATLGCTGVVRGCRQQYSQSSVAFSKSSFAGRSLSSRFSPVFSRHGHVDLIVCSAVPDNEDFQRRASKAVDDAKYSAGAFARDLQLRAVDLLKKAKKKASAFERENDLTGKARDALRTAGLKFEEVSFEMKKKAKNFDREYRVSEKARQGAEAVADRAQKVDRQYGVRQKLKSFNRELELKWPTYRRQINGVLQSEVGKALSFLFFLWLLLSGWFFQIFSWSLWLIPLAPMLVQQLAKASIAQGTCPSCGTPFIGPKRQVLMCQRCRGTVWQPRDKSSFDNDAGGIIDIDPE